MTEPSNLRDAAEVAVTEADQLAAEAWLNANNGEWIDALNLAEAFARHRAAVEAATIAKVVAWLRSDKIVLSMDGSAEDVAASVIQTLEAEVERLREAAQNLLDNLLKGGIGTAKQLEALEAALAGDSHE